MGRKILSCNIGDIFGCFKVLSNPYILGEHSFVHVKCIYCGEEQDLTLSEIKNRLKQRCQYCRGEMRKTRPDPIQGEVYKNWKVLDGKVRSKGFWLYKCECTICHHVQYIRKDQLFNKVKRCENCKYKAYEEQHRARVLKENIKRNQPYLTMFNHVCREAALRGILVTISPEYIEYIHNKQNKCCAITGDPIPDIRKASIDRIDSKKPYEEGNIQIVTKQANLSKHIMSMNELYEFCKKVLNHANQQPSTPLTKCEGSETNS